jgi:hypothetical protein
VWQFPISASGHFGWNGERFHLLEQLASGREMIPSPSGVSAAKPGKSLI